MRAALSLECSTTLRRLWRMIGQRIGSRRICKATLLVFTTVPEQSLFPTFTMPLEIARQQLQAPVLLPLPTLAIPSGTEDITTIKTWICIICKADTTTKKRVDLSLPTLLITLTQAHLAVLIYMRIATIIR